MLLEILGVLATGGLVCGIIKSGNNKKEMPQKSNSDDEPNDKLHLSQYVTHGNHRYREKGEVAEVILTNPQKNIVRTIIEDNGRINNFPGFEHPELIACYLEDVSDGPYVRFRSDFEKTEDGYMFCWEIQPDGRYWADEDGFGFGKGEELILYAYLNDEGLFTSKFKIYTYGVTRYFGTDLEDAEAKKQKEHTGIDNRLKNS